MTATVLALLIQDGHFSWSTTLSDALPGFNISSTHDGTTIEMLTAHRSGITDGYIKDIAFTLSLYNMSAIEGRWAVSNRSLASPPSHSPGSYTYANTNYVLAGLIIDVASSNSSAEALLCGRVFDPLGITTAGFGPVPETSDTSVDNPWPHMPSPSGSVPYSQVPNSERDNPPALNTAGRVHMAPSDYDRFLQLHLAGASTGSGLATSNPLNLTSSSFAKLYEPYPESNISAPGYGYTYGGWLQRNYTQAQPGAPVFTLFHDGSNTLNFAVALLDTKLDEAYMALTNVEGTGALTATDEAVLAMRNGTISLL
jgi:D-alanyl-D-alanine carboxypeptidase